MKNVTHFIETIAEDVAADELAVTSFDDDFADTDCEPEAEQVVSIPIDFVDVDPIELTEIRDTQGRLSDALEALENVTGLSVIPLSMARIAPEVVSLQRHTIFTFNGCRYAMSQRKREHVVNAFKEKILQCLSVGLPFRENLVITTSYEGKDYTTLALSQLEWTYIASVFRKYKLQLTIQNGSQLILELFAERV